MLVQQESVGSNTKPATLAPDFDAIPQALRERPKWVAWRWEWNKKRGEWVKAPIDAKTGDYASTTSPSTWASFELARVAYENSRIVGGPDALDGIGLVLDGDGLVGIDVDQCLVKRADGHAFVRADLGRMVQALNSYSELSVRGEGVHVLVHGRKTSKKCRREPVEVYEHARYLIVTGAHVDGTPTTVEERQEPLDKLCAWIDEPKDAPPRWDLLPIASHDP